MLRLKVVFEVQIYEGRVNEPYEQQAWDLWFYDQFLKNGINKDFLRGGEHVKLLSVTNMDKKDGG